MSFRTLISLWNKFWFEPSAPTPIALYRIFLGLILLECFLVHVLPLYMFFYGDNSVLPVQDVQNYWWKSQAEFDVFMLLPPGDFWRWAYFDVLIAATLGMIFGLFTRTSIIICFITLLSMHRHFPFNTNGGDNFLRITTFILCFSNAGRAISLDNLIRSLKEDWRSTGFAAPLCVPWAQRLLQVQLCIGYFYTFLAKISGEAWIKGTACYYSLRLEDLVRFPLPPIVDNPIAMKLLTWGTMVVEFSLAILIWIKELRYWIIALGLLFHLTIEWSINLPMFEWIFMSTYILFVQPEDLTRAMNFLKLQLTKKLGEPEIVAFDGDCIFCVRIAGVIHRLDIFGRLRLVDFRQEKIENVEFDYSRAEKEMLVQTKKGFVGGFFGFREITKRTPLLWIFVPILYFPGVSFIGKPVYDYVAKNRYRILGGRCSNQIC